MSATNKSLTAASLVEPEASRKKQPFFGPLLFYKRPTVVGATLFLLILSGPPRFRIRDAEASLHGDVDWVVILHLAVWGLAGLWVLWQFAKRFQTKRRLLRPWLPQKLALLMIFVLAASSLVSDAPALSAFKVYQMLVSLLFTQIFVERFGAWTSLRMMVWGNTLLCAAITFCAVFVPDEVWTYSEFNPDPSRLFGGRIAPTGVVSMLALILLLTSARKVWKVLPLSLVAVLLGLVLVSLMRTAYVAASVFFLLVLLTRPNIKPLRRFTYCLCLALLMSYAIGHLPSVSDYRDPVSVSTLSDRTGLWRHLTDVTLSQSPFLGLGYYSASRVYGPEYNPGFGTAHSMFIEVLAGGGLLGFAFLVCLCIALSVYASRLLYSKRDRLSFATSALFIACLIFAAMGDEIDSGPVAVGFWYCAAVLPLLHRRPKIRALVKFTSGVPMSMSVLSGVENS